MYKKATMMKLRFDTARGTVSTEDLFQLPLTELDVLAQRCEAEAQNSEKSFIKKVVRDEQAALRFEIIKDVINTRLEALEARASAQANAEKKQQLLAVLAQKEQAAIGELSTDDIKKMIDEL